MEKVLINYNGATGGDFLRSCLWILKNPNHKLHIEENKLILNDIWLFFIKPNGQVLPNQDISILMDLMRWKNLHHNRRNGLKMHYQWQSNIESEYKLQKKDRVFDSGFSPWPMSAILNSNIDIQVTHDPFEVKYNEIHKIKEIIQERDNILEKLYGHKWDKVYWIFNTTDEDMAWSMYFNSMKNPKYRESKIKEELIFRKKSYEQLVKLLKISNSNIISHNDIINNKVHDFFNLKPTEIYVKWCKIYRKLNKLDKPPERYFELLEKTKKILTKYNNGH